jgi:hypothetical protein
LQRAARDLCRVNDAGFHEVAHSTAAMFESFEACVVGEGYAKLETLAIAQSTTIPELRIDAAALVSR